ncbi:MAG: murein L,D-transpeptidase catalytic domain family protein [Candidatus Cyclobacteriaceae bacterium M2_1C_046]
MKKAYLILLFAFVFIYSNSFANLSNEEKKMALLNYLTSQYEQLSFDGAKPDFEIFQKGLLGYLKLKEQGKVKNDHLTLIDFRVSSKKKRMWIIDMKQNKVVHHSLVAHGKNSGWDIPDNFSNTRNTNKSSLGFYLVSERYIGKYGLSLRLDGMEPGFNSNARTRAIVMHPANYVNDNIGKSLGRLGRSFGCPAIPYKDSKKVVNMIADKSVMFIYYPKEDYLYKTTFADEITAYNYLQKIGMVI